MRKVARLSLAFILVFGFSVRAHTNNLQDLGPDSLGNHLILDKDLSIIWYDYSYLASPLSYPGWQDSVNWADALVVNFNGTIIDNWRLPTSVEVAGPCGPNDFTGNTNCGFNITSSEMGHLYYTELGDHGYYAPDGTNPNPLGYGIVAPVGTQDPFQHLINAGYWSGTRYSQSTYLAFSFWFNSGQQDLEDSYYPRYALAVSPVPAVPEPATMLLLGSGLAGLVGLRRRFRK